MKRETNLPDNYFMYSETYRLNKFGFGLLSKKKKSVRYTVKNQLTAQQLIKLSTLVNEPYYITARHVAIYIFTENEQLLITLCGSVGGWLDILEA